MSNKNVSRPQVSIQLNGWEIAWVIWSSFFLSVSGMELFDEVFNYEAGILAGFDVFILLGCGAILIPALYQLTRVVKKYLNE